MGKKTWLWTVVIIAGLIAVGMFIQKSYPIFAISSPPCNIGDMKCCDFSSAYCSDGSGNIQMKCETYIIDGENRGMWVNYGFSNSCISSTTIPSVVTREQLSNYISQWAKGALDRDKLGQAIQAWIG